MYAKIAARKITLVLGFVFFLAVSLQVLSANSSAQLFQGSKEEVCQGARLDSRGDCAKQLERSPNKLTTTLRNIVDIISVIVGIVAVIMIIINGLRFITSSGDSATVSSAKNGVLYALIGLILVAFAQIIVRFVLTRTT